MLTKRIIPCLDVKDGVVVKGVKFKNHEVVGSIIDLAIKYNDQGADEIVFYDIAASTVNGFVSKKWVNQIAKEINIPFCVAGGIKSIQDAKVILNAGADKVAINSAAIKTPEFVKAAADKFGSQCIVVAIDAKQTDDSDNPRWEIFTHGGRNATGICAIEWAIKMADFGAGEILLTSMDRDGTKNGFDLQLTSRISDAVAVPVIASGGVGNLQHLVDGVQQGGADAVLAASIFHFGEYSIPEAKQFMAQQGVLVR